MLIDVRHTPTTDRQRELVQGASEDFPYTAMRSDLHNYDGGGTPWHWHEHFELGYLKRGCMVLHLQGKNIRLNEGEGYFLNANQLHRSTPVGVGQMELHAQLFDGSVLSGTRLAGRKYIAPVARCFALDVLKLTPEADGPLLVEMEQAYAAAREDATGFELAVIAHLALFWQMLTLRCAPLLKGSAPAEPRESIRMKQMLTFIHGHYAERISVRDIAREAGVCERECYRCFANTMDMTPVSYINSYRVQMAANALTETADPVAEIAERCGFATPSYFTGIFKKIMGCTPAEYRKKQ